MDSDEEDLFSNFELDLSSLSPGDLKEIDRMSQASPSVSIQITNRVDQDGTVSSHPFFRISNDASAPSTGTPYERFRRHGILSVTDLVGPAWCEVQFDYGLRGKKYRKIENRPTSFVSAQGKEIVVEQKVAVRNDATVKRGSAVHEKLEREIRPEVIHVPVVTPEERWALRMVTLISSLDDLMTEGYARELPVFGILEGQVVTGIIDEAQKRPTPAAASPSSKRPADSSSPHASPPKRARRSLSPSQRTLDQLFSNEAGTSALSAPIPTPGKHALYLSDSKTRRAKGIPGHEDTLPSRLQLMLYHRLLSEMMSPAFDFDAIWEKFQLEPLWPLSEDFVKQASSILDSGKRNGGETTQLRSLGDLCVAWKAAVQRLNVVGVEKTLEIVYRSQPRGVDPKEKGKREKDVQLERAIAASLADAGGSINGVELGPGELLIALQRGIVLPSLQEREEDELQRAIAASLGSVDPGVTTDGTGIITTSGDSDLAWAIQESLSPHSMRRDDIGLLAGSSTSTVPSPVQDSPANPMTNEVAEPGLSSVEDAPMGEASTRTADNVPLLDIEEVPQTPTDLGEAEPWVPSKIIGRKKFRVNEEQLNIHIKSILDWWNGRREPVGVAVTQSKRCNSCEYASGCEWRELKAKEFMSKFEAKAKARDLEGQTPS